ERAADGRHHIELAGNLEEGIADHVNVVLQRRVVFDFQECVAACTRQFQEVAVDLQQGARELGLLVRTNEIGEIIELRKLEEQESLDCRWHESSLTVPEVKA